MVGPATTPILIVTVRVALGTTPLLAVTVNVAESAELVGLPVMVPVEASTEYIPVPEAEYVIGLVPDAGFVKLTNPGVPVNVTVDDGNVGAVPETTDTDPLRSR